MVGGPWGALRGPGGTTSPAATGRSSGDGLGPERPDRLARSRLTEEEASQGAHMLVCLHMPIEQINLFGNIQVFLLSLIA